MVAWRTGKLGKIIQRISQFHYPTLCPQIPKPCSIKSGIQGSIPGFSSANCKLLESYWPIRN